jgi:hypothetical protein
MSSYTDLLVIGSTGHILGASNVSNSDLDIIIAERPGRSSTVQAQQRSRDDCVALRCVGWDGVYPFCDITQGVRLFYKSDGSVNVSPKVDRMYEDSPGPR